MPRSPGARTLRCSQHALKNADKHAIDDVLPDLRAAKNQNSAIEQSVGVAGGDRPRNAVHTQSFVAAPDIACNARMPVNVVRRSFARGPLGFDKLALDKRRSLATQQA